MTRPVVGRPRTTLPGVAGGQPVLPDPREQEDLVVHRQSEQDAKIRIGPARDRHRVVEPEELGAPAPLEDHGEHAVRRADRQQVHHRRLERDDDRAEHHASSSTETPHHEPDDQPQPLGQQVRDVGEHRRAAGDLDTLRERVAQLADQVGVRSSDGPKAGSRLEDADRAVGRVSTGWTTERCVAGARGPRGHAATRRRHRSEVDDEQHGAVGARAVLGGTRSYARRVVVRPTGCWRPAARCACPGRERDSDQHDRGAIAHGERTAADARRPARGQRRLRCARGRGGPRGSSRRPASPHSAGTSVSAASSDADHGERGEAERVSTSGARTGGDPAARPARCRRRRPSDRRWRWHRRPPRRTSCPGRRTPRAG